MSNKDIIRAWKDEAFRAHLGETLLPEHPAGQIELTDESLKGIQGGMAPVTADYTDCCTFQTWKVQCSAGCSIVEC